MGETMRVRQRAVLVEKLTNQDCSVTGSIVVAKNPVLRMPQAQPFSSSAVVQDPQNFAAKLFIDDLARGPEFSTNHAAAVENDGEHAVD